jgi:hypothetical protein
MRTLPHRAIKNKANKNIFERNPKTTILICVVLFFIAVETFGEIIYYYTHQHTFIFNKTNFVEFSPYGWVHYKPNSIILLHGYAANLETDQYGFVHNGYKKAIDHDQYLIFLVGGSSAEGRGSSSNAATIAACLERILNLMAGKNRFRVVNAGMSGFVTYQELSLLAGEIIPKFRPQMVIALDGHNDGWCAVTFQEWRPNWQPYVDQLTRDVNRNMEPGFGILTDLIKRHSIIAATFEKIGKKVFYRGDKSFTQKTMPPEVRLESAATEYIANQKIIKEVLQLHGSKYHVFLQPFLANYLKKEIKPRELKFMQDWGAEYNNGDIYYLGMKRFYEILIQQAGSLSFFTDLSKVFIDTPENTYVDNCHFNDTGNMMIAETIAHQLWPELANIQ